MGLWLSVAQLRFGWCASDSCPWLSNYAPANGGLRNWGVKENPGKPKRINRIRHFFVWLAQASPALGAVFHRWCRGLRICVCQSNLCSHWRCIRLHGYKLPIWAFGLSHSISHCTNTIFCTVVHIFMLICCRTILIQQCCHTSYECWNCICDVWENNHEAIWSKFRLTTKRSSSNSRACKYTIM